MTYDVIDGRYPLDAGSYQSNASLYYQINNGPINELEPVQTAETHATYYGDAPNSNATPGWQAADKLGICVHQNTNNTDDYMLIVVFDDANHDAPSWDFDVNFSEAYSGSPEIQDDTGDTYTTTSAQFTGGSLNTDGMGIDMSDFTDVDITINDTNGTIGSFDLIEGPNSPSSEIAMSKSDTLRIVNRV